MRSAATFCTHSFRERFAVRFALFLALLIVAIPASAGNNLTVTTLYPANGQTVSGSITWQVAVTSGNVVRVDFAVDGTVKWTEHYAPWLYNGVTGGLNTTTLSDGTHQLTAKAYSKNGRSTGTSTVTINVSNTAPAPPPPPQPPTSSVPPSISGTPTVGQTLSTSNGTWSGSTPMTYAYGWARCDSSGGNCSPISAATSATYAVTSADVGATLRASVTATNSAGSATATSGATAAVAPLPAAPAPPPSPLGSSLPPRMPESSGSTSIYVAPTGSDSNPGTFVSPVKTLSRAFSLASSGTKIFVRGGTYATTQLVQHRFFSASNPVTVQSYPGETATFVGGTAHPANAVEFDDVTGIRIRNITIAARLETNLKLVDAQHVEVDGIVSRDAARDCPGGTQADYATATCAGNGLLISGASTSGYTNSLSTDVQVWNSTFTNNGGHTTGLGGSIRHDHELYLCSSGSVYGATTKGGCDSFVVANNLIYDAPTGEAIQIGDSARNGFIVNNTIDNTDTRSTSGTSLCTDYSSQAMVVWGGGNYPTTNTVITNNIVSNNCGPGVNASTSGSLVGNVVRNNFGYHNAYACDWCKSGVDYDPIYGSYVGFTVGTNLPDADPLYVNRTGSWSSASKNFHLQAASPALGKSDPAYTPPLDKDGKARPSTPALGAYG